MKMHHVGIVVKNIKKAAERLNLLGSISEIYLDSVQKVKVAFIIDSNTDAPSIELIEPIDKSSSIANLLNKDISIYHLCYSVKDLDEAISLMSEEGFIPIAPPTPAIAFQNRRIAFLFSKDKVMIELLEE